MKKNFVLYGITLIVGAGLGCLGMYIGMNKVANENYIKVASTVAYFQINQAAVIYMSEDGDRKEAALDAIDFVNFPEYEKYFTEDVKAYSKDIYKKVEDETYGQVLNQ